MSGTLQTLGVHVPQPEVSPDDTNPKGFGEPQWAVDFHDRYLIGEDRVYGLGSSLNGVGKNMTTLIPLA